jgi:hypothetical protein
VRYNRDKRCLPRMISAPVQTKVQIHFINRCKEPQVHCIKLCCNPNRLCECVDRHRTEVGDDHRVPF